MSDIGRQVRHRTPSTRSTPGAPIGVIAAVTYSGPQRVLLVDGAQKYAFADTVVEIVPAGEQAPEMVVKAWENARQAAVPATRGRVAHTLARFLPKRAVAA